MKNGSFKEFAHCITLEKSLKIQKHKKRVLKNQTPSEKISGCANAADHRMRPPPLKECKLAQRAASLHGVEVTTVVTFFVRNQPDTRALRKEPYINGY